MNFDWLNHDNLFMLRLSVFRARPAGRPECPLFSPAC